MTEGVFYKTVVCSSWGEAKERITSHGAHWVFRGQADERWSLTTSLQRTCRRIEMQEAEPLLIRSFKRKAHLYVPPNLRPEVDNDLEWLALMQHHGTPTALLDATWSPYIAAYFASEAVSMDAQPAVWALDSRWLKASAVDLLPKRSRDEFDVDSDTDLGAKEFFSTVILANTQPMVFPVIPTRVNERLSVQQGLFLCPGSVVVGFMENLAANANDASGAHIVKYVLPSEARVHALRDLHQMNITRTSLFPGIDGFARSLSRSLFVLEQSRAFLEDLADGLPEDFHL